MKLKKLLFFGIVFSLVVFSSDVFGATVYYCPTSGNSYSSSGACSSHCTKIAACSNFNASNSVIPFNSKDVNVIANTNYISFYNKGILKLGNGINILDAHSVTNWDHNCIDHYETSRLQRIWASGSKLYLDYHCSFNGRDSSGYNRTLTVNIPGANMSGDSGYHPNGISVLKGDGNKIKVTFLQEVCTGSGRTRNCSLQSTFSNITLGQAVCPLLGGSSCSGTPKTCSAAQACQSIALIDNAKFVSYANIPVTVSPGQTFTASITMKNNGDTTWTRGANFKLGSRNPVSNLTWGINRVTLPVASIAPGQSAIFTQTFTAPTAPGMYNFQWQMLIEGVKWFGGLTANRQITVSAPMPERILSIDFIGSGAGSVSGTSSLNCSGDCTKSYINGITVAIEANLNNGSSFVNWTGCDSVNGSICNVLMNSNKTISPKFDLICIPNNNCAVNTCVGDSCLNGCGGFVDGIKNCNTKVDTGIWREITP